MTDPVERFLTAVKKSAELFRPQFEADVLTGFHLDVELNNDTGEWETRGGPVHNQRLYNKFAKRAYKHVN